MEISLKKNQTRTTSAYLGMLIFLFMLCWSLNSNLYSQETSNNDYTGAWTDDASWIDGTSPEITVDGTDLDIYGYITLSGDFDYNNGLLEIVDTLVVEGNFTLQNNGDLRIGDEGLLIVLGDYLSNNQVQVNTEGIIIVAGEFEMLGANNQGSFANDGTVYLLDDTPEIKNGLEYVDLLCADPSDYPANCGYGNEGDIGNDPDLWDFFNQLMCSSSDVTEPIVTTYPSNISTNVDAGSCSAIVTYTAPKFEDNCSGTGINGTLTAGLASGSSFPLGTTTVTYIYTDDAGNGPASCSFTVTVTDNINPEITCPGDIEQCADDASGATINGIAPLRVLDNCTAISLLNVHFSITGATTRSGNDDASGNFGIGSSLVEYTVSDQSGNSVNCSFTVIVNELPEILLSGEYNCTTGEILARGNSSSGTSVDFSTDGGLSVFSTDSEAPFEFNTPVDEGESITLVARSYNSATGCQGDWSAPLALSANGLPVTGSIIADSPGIDHFDEACVSDSATYSIAAVPGSTHNWSIPALSYSQEGADQISVNWELGEGEYTIQVMEITENGCEGSVTEETVYLAEPVVSLGGNQDICTGESYTFEPDGDWASYYWYDGSGSPPHIAPQFTADQTLRVSLTVTDYYGCTATDYAFLVLHENAAFNLGNDTILCGDTDYEIEVDGFDSYEWSTGETSSTLIVYPGQQVIWLRATDRFGCSVTDSINILACEESGMFDAITNTFTPNNDGVNETWVIDNIELYPEADVLVFDRSGRIVFEARNGYNNDWDGSLNGTPLPMDAYYYIIDSKSVGVKPIQGALTIIR